MSFLEFVRMAWSSILGHKIRSGLTLLGIVIGVFAIIASVTAVQVIDVFFQDSINFLGSNTFTVQRMPGVRMGPMDERIRNRPSITYEQLLMLRRRIQSTVEISPDESFAQTMVKFGGEQTKPNIIIKGSDENWTANSSFEIAQGRNLTPTDVQYARPVALIGHTLVTELFPNEVPLGKDIVLDGYRLKVVGVLKERGEAMGNALDDVVVAPITRMFSAYGDPLRSISIDVRVENVDMLPVAMDEVTGLMRTIRRVDARDENNFDIVTNESLVSTFTTFTGFLTLGGLVIGGISLFAAGIGVMNIMLVSVTERTKEIGIRKSLGATSGAIRKQFLLEAIFLCQIGGILGILLGIGAGNLMAFSFEISPVFPWDWAIGGTLGLTLIAIVFGVYPAAKAAKLHPIEALRRE